MKADVTFRHRVRVVQLGTFDLFEQHRRNDRLLMLCPESETGDDVRLGGQKMDGRTFARK
jgi:hypothetical protein